MKTQFFIIVGFVLLLGGCCAKVVGPTVVSETDSTTTETVPRVERVYTPAITTSLDLQIECDPVTLKPKPTGTETYNWNQKLKAAIDSVGNLHIECITDSLEHEIEVRDTIIKNYRQTTIKTPVAQDKPTPWYDYAARFLSGALLLIIALKFILK